MVISNTVINLVSQIPRGQLFGYRDLSPSKKAPGMVMRVLSQMVKDNKIKRFAKNQYYLPEPGVVKPSLKPSPSEIYRSIMFNGKNQVGYVTGYSLYNKLGLTTQVPMVITIALEKYRNDVDYGYVRISFVKARAPIKSENIQLLQYLDVIRTFKKVPDASDTEVLKAIGKKLLLLSNADLEKIQRLAIKYYNPATVAVLGLLLSDNKTSILSALKNLLNPVTQFKLRLSEKDWQNKKEWNIV